MGASNGGTPNTLHAEAPVTAYLKGRGRGGLACLSCGVALALSCVGSSAGDREQSTEVPATDRAFPPVVVESTERRQLASAFVDDTFKIHVYFPRGYHESDGRLPVVYLLDAEYSFGAVAYTIRRLIKDDLIPPVLLVGVAYEVPYDEYYRRRERDFTPTSAHLNDFPRAGHAGDFAQFLREELVPFVSQTYHVDPNDRTIVGLSFSGLFSTYLLVRETDLFNRYVIVSPSLWWDNGVTFGYESDYHSQHAELEAHVYFAAGEDDGWNILRDLRRMEQVLEERRYIDLEYEVRLFPDETHRTVFPIAVSHGLRFVFSAVE